MTRVILKNRFSNLFLLISIKSVSLLLTTYVLLYLFYFGNLSSVGVFSAITAILSPLAMFASFRYLEWMALHSDKTFAFSVSITSAVIIYLALSCMSWLFLINIECNRVVIIFFITYKLFELISEFYFSFLANIGKVFLSAVSIFFRLALLIVLSVFGFLLKLGDVLFLISASLVISHVLVLFLFDIPNILRKKYFVQFSLKEFFDYILQNSKFGMLSSLVSLNSSLPRYYLTFVGDLEILGFFSLNYLIASTAVNILQYPLSIKIVKIRNYLTKNFYLVRLSIFGLTFLIAGLVITSGAKFFDDFIPDSFNILNFHVIFLIDIFMFIFLMWRGVLFSYSISLNTKIQLHWFTLLSSFFGFLFLSFLKFFGYIDSSLIVSFLFVSISSYFSIIFVYFSVKRSTGHHVSVRLTG